MLMVFKSIFVKNPTCPNYGVPASTKKQPRGRPRANVPGSDNYKVLSSARQVPILKCLFCNEYPPIKSNLAIQEEVSRLIEYLKGKKNHRAQNFYVETTQ